MKRLTVAISPFANSINSGHSLIDDEFYFEYLVKKNADFIFYTSKISADRILLKFKCKDSHLRVIDDYNQNGIGHFKYAYSLKIPKNSKVIFFGYSEKLVSIWYTINAAKPFDLILVATNNISARRVSLYRRSLQSFFRLINSKLRRLVLHTNHEVHLVGILAHYVLARCFVKKHHLMIPKAKSEFRSSPGMATIAYFGPPKPEKPLRPLIDLVQADQNLRISFKLFNVEKSYFLEQSGLSDIPANVLLHNDWMTDDEYRAAFMSCDLVLMTHTNEFEGKLSGNLCDCIAYGIPYIAQPIEPLIDMQSHYGSIGFLCDLTKQGWASDLIDEIDSTAIEVMAKNMRAAGAQHSLTAIIQDLDQALEV